MKKIGLIHNVISNMTSLEVNPLLVPSEYSHCAIVGETGCGKTSSAILPNIDQRIQEGHGILVYDYKGNMHAKVKALAKSHNRLEDVMMIGVPWGESINLIGGLTMSEIETMLTQLMGHKEEDRFWTRAGLDIAIPIITLLRKIENVKKAFADTSLELSFDVSYRGKMVCYDAMPTIASLNRILSNLNEFKMFTMGYEELLESLKNQFKQKSYSLRSCLNIEYKTALFKELINYIDEINTLHKKYQNMDTSKHTTFSSIHISLVGALSQLSTNSGFNMPKCNIATELSRGKIVIVDMQTLSEMPLGFLTQSIFSELKSRFIYPVKNPISIFIDEAQKVLNKEFSLPLDTMREAKVEVFMAYQNPSLLIDVLGESGYSSIHTNLTKKFVYRSDTLFDRGTDTSDYKPFEYAYNREQYANRYQAQPMFLTPEEEFEAEYLFQSAHNLHQQFILDTDYPQKSIIIFDARLYEEKTLIFQNIDFELSQKQFVAKSIFDEGKVFLEQFQENVPDHDEPSEIDFEDDDFINTINEILGQS